VSAITLDNASNNTTMLRKIQDLFDNMDPPLVFDEDGNRARSVALCSAVAPR
jgi:hypothetical protein